MYKIYYSRKVFALLNDHPSYKAFVTRNIFVKFHHNTPNSKGTRGQNIFFTLTSAVTLINWHVQKLHEIR